MSKYSGVLKAIEYAFGTSIVAAFSVLLIGACAFGFQFNQWPEWEGRLVGMFGTIAGIAGAAVGVGMALRAERRAMR
jgi:hypothetical protein